MKPKIIQLKSYFFAPRWCFSRVQFNLVALIFICVGFVIGSYFTLKGVVTIFAATSPWTQTDWSGGGGASTTNQYSAISNTDATGTAGQLTLSLTAGWSTDYSAWLYRKKITFNNTTANLGVTSEALTDFPVLVKLDSGTDVDYTKTKDAGEDIRFTDSDGTVLPYEIEKWDETGSSYVWVKVPQIDIDSNTDYVYVYYGNTGANDGQSASSVWNSNYVGVWHLNDASGTTATDSVSSPHNGTADGTSITTGLFGNSRSFTYNTSDNVHLTLGSSLTTYTVEAWAYPTTITQSYHHVAESNFQNIINTSKFCPIWAICSSVSTVTINEWQHFVLAYTNTPTVSWTGYRNGTSVVTGTAVASPNTSWVIGHYNVLNTANNETFNGKIDEVRISNVKRSAAWIAASYKSGADAFNTLDTETNRYVASGTLTSNILDSGFATDWGNLTYTSSGTGTVTVKVRTSNSATMVGATDWASCTAKTSGVDLTGGCVTDTERYVQYQVTLESSAGSTPTFTDISIAFTASDQVKPITNATAVAITGITDGAWTNTEPTITWTAGADNIGGGGLVGYCVTLDEVTITGTEISTALDPETSTSKLAGIDDGVTNTSTCEYIVTGTSLNLSSLSGLTLSSGKHYYFSIKAVDVAGNVYTGDSGTYQDLVSFKYDGTTPTNPAYLSLPGDFVSTKSATIIWPTSGADAAADSNSGVAGLQYRIGLTGIWYGDTHNGEEDITDLLTNDGSYSTVQNPDFSAITEGSNLVYLRTWDSAGNVSTSYISGALKVNSVAPSAPLNLAVSSSTSTTNSYSFTWDDPTTYTGQANKLTFCYTINTLPSATACNFTVADANALAADAYATQPSTNTLYVVAKDESGNINYETYASIAFTYSGSAPGIPRSADVADVSVKATSSWKLALSWETPADVGAGVSNYRVYRSADNVTFTNISSTTGIAYTDTGLAALTYYYYIKACDSANNCGAASTTVSKLPTGKYTTAATLSSGPTSGSITTKKATITWSTDRTSDSKIAYGTSTGSYGSDEVANSSQVTSHSVNLTNLKAGTTYYYKAKWTDEDGNIGTSDEKTFSTTAAPTTKNVSVTNIGLTTGLINYTVTNASSVKIYYGTTTSYGGASTVSTSTSETAYTTQLIGLLDGTKYYYKINTFDSDGNEYEGTVLDFTTLPRPKITNIRIQQVANTAQSTILVTWSTNTEVSSIVTYYPQGLTGNTQDEVNVALTKGEHQMILRGLLPQTDYILVVKGRDKAGNEATSDSQRVTTATDTRPPQVSDLRVEGTNVQTNSQSTSQESTAQLLISWNTDEPATSQVEFGEGTGSTYSQKTQEDSNLTLNHLVIITSLSPSKVYHLRSLSKDKVGNTGNSIDTVTITPKATDSAFNLVVTNLQQAFGFLGRL